MLLWVADAWARNIVIFGDAQHDNAVQKSIVKLALTFKPSTVFRVGDIVDDGNNQELWDAFRRINKPLLETTRYFPVLGNHDKESPLYFAQFPQINNSSWYSINREGIHFIILDSNLDLKPGSPQYESLVNDLRDSKDKFKFKIVLFHHPMFNVAHHKEDEKGLRPILLPLLKEYGVSAVFSGHEHSYQHLQYEGIDFIVTGGAGSRLLSQTRDSPYLKKFIKAYHLCLLIPGNDFLTLRVIDNKSSTIDEFKIFPPGTLRE
ncbi:MAG: metallophosphoesterase [Candidatus Omnitrophica bacterium]|nr:metallophosphoesterase [Candidatus Omnitrophota bacterium]